MNGKTFWIGGELFRDALQLVRGDSGRHFVLSLVAPARILVPIRRQFAQHRRLLHLRGVIVGSINLGAEILCHAGGVNFVFLRVDLKQRAV